jgi:heme/copper-type cytochrome/quinol oxidase subunit 2
MVEKDEKLIIGFILWIVLVISNICYRCYRKRQTNERIHHPVTHLTSSQIRPLIIYHLPISSIQEPPPPSYDQVMRT